MSVLILGGFTLVALGYFPSLAIQPASRVSLYELLKFGGGGIALALLGTLLLQGGFRAIATRGVDEGQKKPGCLGLLGRLAQISLGLILLIAGLGLIALAIYQQLIPLLGYKLV